MTAGPLVQLGQRRPAGGSVVEMLADCHARIRGFTALAVRLAQADADPAQLGDAAARLHRYFTVALPLHVADEERSVRPRLEPTASAELSDTFTEMSNEHTESDALVARLLPFWESSPTRSQLRGTLVTARTLAELMERHLAREEHVLFPAVARLPSATQKEIAAEMRARRSVRLP